MKKRYFIVPMLALLCFVPGCLEFYGYPVTGVEFSPDSFTLREFSYWRSPFTGSVRSKRFLTPVDPKCDSLITLNLIPASGTTNPRWDLVSESLQTSKILSGDFDARFLTIFLNHTTDQWNRNNVEKAEILWPEVATLARERLYLQLPTLFHFAIDSPEEWSNEEFEEQLKRELAKAWFSGAQITADRVKTHTQSIHNDTDNGDRLDGTLGEASVADATRFLDKAIELDPQYRNRDVLLLEVPIN